MNSLGVDCTFSPDGTVRVRRIKIREKWHSVGQGRQWFDQNGRHVLIMLAGNEVIEIILRPGTLVWEMKRKDEDRTLA